MYLQKVTGIQYYTWYLKIFNLHYACSHELNYILTNQELFKF